MAPYSRKLSPFGSCILHALPMTPGDIVDAPGRAIGKTSANFEGRSKGRSSQRAGRFDLLTLLCGRPVGAGFLEISTSGTRPSSYSVLGRTSPASEQEVHLASHP